MWNTKRVIWRSIIKFKIHKVIGVHKGGQDKKEYNLGTIIKIPIKEFWKSIKNSFEINSKKILFPRIRYYPTPVGLEKLEIIMAQTKCIIKILKTDGNQGTGFFAYIPVNKKNPVLITCNNTLNENCISLNNEIKFTINNNKMEKMTKIDKNRKTYINQKFDITFIEITENDKY